MRHTNPASCVKSGQRAFTLIELLVVISIIVLLVSILMPSLKQARELARDVACKANMRNMATAFLVFAADHNDHLPGIKSYGTLAWQKSWLYGNYPTEAQWFPSAPQEGTLYKYTGGLAMYRCPAIPAAKVDSGLGSNGRFDYQSYGLLSGALLGRIPIQARPYLGQAWNGIPMFSTPILREQHYDAPPGTPGVYLPPGYPGLNDPGGKVDNPGYGQMQGNWHFGGGNNAGIDGTVYRLGSPVMSFPGGGGGHNNGAAWNIDCTGTTWPWGNTGQLYFSLGFNAWP